MAAHLAGGALLALPKGDGDVRPIAVGETLRRLVGKCLCEAVREDAKAHFCPLRGGRPHHPRPRIWLLERTKKFPSVVSVGSSSTSQGGQRDVVGAFVD